MKQVEQNIFESFEDAKKDVLKLQQDVSDVAAAQKRIVDILNKLSTTPQKTQRPVQVIVKTARSPRVKHTFIASKTGKKFHYDNCFFAKNIKPKSRITFKSKDAALNKGFKACECLKKV